MIVCVKKSTSLKNTQKAAFCQKKPPQQVKKQAKGAK
jgi:hypothetical protein